MNIGKLYLLLKIYKCHYNVPGRPVISDCGALTEEASEFFDIHVQLLMQSVWLYIQDSTDF